MSYVLILLAGALGPPVALATAQFDTEQHCVAAGEAMKNEVKKKTYYDVFYVCVPR